MELKKITCKVCGSEFYPIAENRYTAKDADGLVIGITNGVKRYDAFDCPVCGCQNIAGVRMIEIEREADKQSKE